MDKFLDQMRQEKRELCKKYGVRRLPHHVVRTIGSRTPEELEALAYNIIALFERDIESGKLIIHEDGSWEICSLKKK